MRVRLLTVAPVVLRHLCILAFAGTLFAQDFVPGKHGAQKKVLVVYSSRVDAPYTALVERTLAKTLSDGLNGRLDYYTEYIDFGRFSTVDYQLAVRDFLRRKYAGQRLDLIVTEGAAPFDFVVRHREEVFPGVPVVFSAEDNDSVRIPNTTGVVFPVDMKTTLDVALRLQPHLEHVFVVRGASNFDKFYEAIARRQFRDYEGRIAFTYLPALPLQDLMQRVARLPPNSIVYFVSLFEDGAGDRFVPVDALGRLSSVASAPLYCWPEMTLGYGVVGGSLLSEEAIAHQTAQLALRILRGENADQIPIMVTNPYKTAFDWRQLQRWRIPEDQLPPGSEVRFRTLTAWDRYRWHIIGAVTIILAQTGLIAALLLQRHRRRRAELALQRHRMELAHAGRLATVGALTAAIAHEINQPLGAILSNTDSAEMLLQAGASRLDEVRRILVEIRNDDLRAAEVIRRLRSLLSKHQITRERIDLHETIAEALHLLEAEARRRDVQLMSYFGSTHTMILADRIHVQQVVINLVSNAMDAMAQSDAGMRQVMVQTAMRSPREVEVAVIDRGPGVAPGDLPRLFEPYFTTKDHGMGMGLSIARTIVEAHGGKIWAEAGSETGAVFRFTLPIAATATQPSVAERAA